MRVRARLVGSVLGACALLALQMPSSFGAVAMAPRVPFNCVGTTHVVGVDNTSPAGHNYIYTDFFPRSGVQAVSGDCVEFKFVATAGADNGFHTATLLTSSENLGQHQPLG